MKALSLSKNLAIVMVALFTASSLNAADPVKPAATVAGSTMTPEQLLKKAEEDRRKDAEAAASATARQTGVRSAVEKFDSTCKSAQKEMTDAIGGFLSYCKTEFRKEISNDDPLGKDKREKAIKACAQDFDDCQELGKEEKAFSSMMSGMSGAEAMPNFPFGSEESKSCSKYSRDQLQSAVDKATTALDTKNKDLKDLGDKNFKSEQDLQKDYDKLQKEFVEAQEAKAKATRDGEEEKLNKQASFDKQKADYEAQIRKTDAEIFQLQQQASLMIKARGKEVNAYKISMLKCKEEVRKIQSSMQSQVSSNLSIAQQSDARIVWTACRSNALQDRENEAEKHKVAMATLEMNLKYKMAEAQSIKASADRLASMFNTSNQKQQEYDAQNEQKFLEKQQQTWLQISKSAQDKQKKTMENQQHLVQAQQAVTTASNKLNDFESQEARGTKPLEDAIGNIAKYGKIQAAADLACKETDEIIASRNFLKKDLQRAAEAAQ